VLAELSDDASLGAVLYQWRTFATLIDVRFSLLKAH
jgi:hypothetical protein